MVLHILLIILKIIGIIIAVLFSLVLLLLLILLCVPVRYRLDASMPGEIKKSTARGRVTWLLRLIRIDVSFKEQELKWRVRIAWKSFGSGRAENGEKQSKATEDTSVKAEITNQETKNRETEKEVTHEKRNTDQKEVRNEQRMESGCGLQKVEKESAEEKTTVEGSKTVPENVENGSGEKTEKSQKDISEKIHERSEKVQPEKGSEEVKTNKKPEKIDGRTKPDISMDGKEKTSEEAEEKAGRFEKIKCTIVKFCDKIRHTVGHAEEKLNSLSEKKDKIVKELEDPVHQKAFSKVKKEAGKLLKRWKPKVIKGTVHFGFEDPYHTGQALAGLSMIYPFIGDHLSVEPDFEKRILKGNIKVCGGFRILSLVCFLWNLVWCKEIRKTYHDIREFQL